MSLKSTNSNVDFKNASRKKIIFTVGGIAAFIFFIFLLSGPFLNGIIKPKILKSINKNENIKLVIEDLTYNLFTNNFYLERNSFYTKNNSEEKDSFKINAPSITIGGINWLNYFFNNKIDVNNIQVNNPQINIYSSKNISKSSSSNSNSFNLKSLNNFLFECSRININSGSLIRKNTEGKTVDSINSFTIQITDIDIDSSNDKDSKFIKNISLDVKGIYKLFVIEGYKLKIGLISVSSSNSSIKIKSINLKPYISDDEFFSRKKFRSDRIIIDINNFEANKFNISQLLKERDIISDGIKISDFYVDILTPKNLPIVPHYSPQMPNEIFRSLKNKIDINALTISKGNLVIESKYDYSKQPAKLAFTNIEADIKNISNIRNKQKTNNNCEIFAAANIADAGRLRVNMNIPLLSKDFSLTYSGTLNSMDPERFNSQLMIADLTKITSGNIDSVWFHVKIENGLSSSKVNAIYNDLKIKILKEEGMNDQPETSSLETFLSNKLVLRQSNPNDEGINKTGTFYYSQKNDDAFMDVVWLSVKGALGDIVGF